MLITIEKYIYDGKISRVVIRSQSNNYFLDLPIASITARSFLIAGISLIKACSFLFHNFNVAVKNLSIDNLIQ